MTGTLISDVLAWEALDSRGNPTVACRVRLEGGAEGRALTPAGASTGGHEACERRDGGDRFGGRGVQGAVAAVRDSLASVVVGMDAAQRRDVDSAMEAADGEADLSRLGANAVLAVSLAVTVAAAQQLRAPLWRLLDGGSRPLLPMPMVNVLSGGAHAGRALDVQDVLVVPIGASCFAEAIEWCWRVRTATAGLLERHGGPCALVADEGGLCAALPSNEAALELVTAGIEAAGLEPARQAALAVDLAANQFWDGDAYHLAVEGLRLDPGRWLDRVASWCSRYPIVSVEDVLQENDWSGWADATRRLRALQVLGDDLFATGRERLDRGIEQGVANAVLVKPNQAGTLSRAEDVVRRAREAGYAMVVSARSGDTEDDWLADLAVGWRAGQVKVGSTTRSERTAKWNRLLEIEATASGDADFAGAAALAGERMPGMLTPSSAVSPDRGSQ